MVYDLVMISFTKNNQSGFQRNLTLRGVAPLGVSLVDPILGVTLKLIETLGEPETDLSLAVLDRVSF